jgi:hypothetical protein
MLALAACSYRGGIDNPLVRRAGWFSYLDGADIRAACTEGALDSYRLVYNGRYEEQLRSYEITADGAGGAYLVARAMGRRPNLARVSLNDILAPWRWRRSEARLKPAELRQFVSMLEASGMFDGPPVGLRLFSGDFYWVASGCRNGVFYFNAWLYPSDRFARLRFHLFSSSATRPDCPSTHRALFRQAIGWARWAGRRIRRAPASGCRSARMGSAVCRTCSDTRPRGDRHQKVPVPPALCDTM